MNQILDFGAGGNNDNNNDYNKKEKKSAKKKENFEYNNYNNYANNGENFGGNNDFGSGKKVKNKTPMSDKVVKVFALLMIVLAIGLIASGVLSIMKNKKDTEESETNIPTAPQVQANIDAELDEITGKVKIMVDSPVTISKIIYSWDQDHDNVVSGEKQTSIEEEIIAPYGEHVLHVQVTDEQNNKTTRDFTFDSAMGMDTTQPEITLTITEDKKLLITATDDTSIAYVTYTWNNEETQTREAEEEGMQKLEFTEEIPKGKNTIVVVAVDGSESSNARTVSKVFEGVTKPEINYGFLDSVGSVLQIMCSHENGIKSIYYTLNGQPYQWQVGEGEEAPKELTFQQESVPGHNEMTIKVTSVDDTVAEFNPAWDYAAPNEETPSEEVSAQDTETTEDTNTADTNTTVEGDINSDTDSTNQVTTTGDNTNTTTNN